MLRVPAPAFPPDGTQGQQSLCQKDAQGRRLQTHFRKRQECWSGVCKARRLLTAVDGSVFHGDHLSIYIHCVFPSHCTVSPVRSAPDCMDGPRGSQCHATPWQTQILCGRGQFWNREPQAPHIPRNRTSTASGGSWTPGLRGSPVSVLPEPHLTWKGGTGSLSTI